MAPRRPPSRLIVDGKGGQIKLVHLEDRVCGGYDGDHGNLDQGACGTLSCIELFNDIDGQQASRWQEPNLV